MNQNVHIFFGKGADHLRDAFKQQNQAAYASTFFPDGEISFTFEGSVKDQSITLIQSISPPIHDHLIELLIMLDVLRSQGPRRIDFLLPYLAYGRQNHTTIPRLIENSGVDQLILIDYHTPETTCFSQLPVKYLSAVDLFHDVILKKFNQQNLVIVSPDSGGMKRAMLLAEALNLPLIALNKKRDAFGCITYGDIRDDLSGQTCILMDDIVDSGETLIQAAEKLKGAGAIGVHAFVTHAVLSHSVLLGDAKQKLQDSSLTSIYVTDTIHHTSLPQKITVLQVAPLIRCCLKPTKTA